MKILHLITGLNVGGAETMLAKLLEHSKSDNDRHEVLSLLDPGKIADRIAALEVPVHTLKMTRGVPTPLAAIRLARLVRRMAPDLLHGWMYHGNLAASFARRVAARNAALVWNVRHSLPDPKLETTRTRVLLRLSAPISAGPEAIVYNANASMEQHSRFGFDRAQAIVLPNGFDTAKFTPDPQARERLRTLFGIAPESRVIACVARLHPMKDHARLVEAVSLARQAGVDIHLLLVGNDLAEPPRELAARIAANLPPDRVTTSGARFDLAEWMPGLDLLALPSAWGEGFPNVVGEALSCAVPVVATDVGDSARIVGDAGSIVPPSDTGRLADAIIEILGKPTAERTALGMAGRLRMKRDYSIETIAKRYRKLHERCLDARRRADGDRIEIPVRS